MGFAVCLIQRGSANMGGTANKRGVGLTKGGASKKVGTNNRSLNLSVGAVERHFSVEVGEFRSSATKA